MGPQNCSGGLDECFLALILLAFGLLQKRATKVGGRKRSRERVGQLIKQIWGESSPPGIKPGALGAVLTGKT